jgi:hypothetical protein
MRRKRERKNIKYKIIRSDEQKMAAVVDGVEWIGREGDYSPAILTGYGQGQPMKFWCGTRRHIRTPRHPISRCQSDTSENVHL